MKCRRLTKKGACKCVSLHKIINSCIFRGQKRKEIEDLVSKMKAKIWSDSMVIRRGMNENDSFRNRIWNLKESVEHVKIENEDLKKEIEIVKDNAFNLEKQTIYLKNSVEEKDQKISQLNKQLDRTKVLLKTQREVNKEKTKMKEANMTIDHENIELSDKENEAFLNRIVSKQKSHSRHNSVSSSYDLNPSHSRRHHNTISIPLDEQSQPLLYKDHNTQSYNELPRQVKFDEIKKPNANQQEFLDRQISELYEK